MNTTAQPIPLFTGSAATAAFRGLVWARLARGAEDTEDRKKCEQSSANAFACARILHDNTAVEAVMQKAAR